MIHPAPLAAIQSMLDRLLAAFNLDWPKVRQVGAGLVVIWVLAALAWQVVRIVAKRIVAAADDHDDATMTIREKRAETVAQLLRSVGKVTILVFAILISLNQFIAIAPLLGGAAVLGLAVSFGAQSLVKDIISGFFILMENQFAVGDIVEIGGKGGVVERMTLRVVMLRDLEGTLHVIPNGQINMVSNRTRGWARAVLDFGVAYEGDVDKALAVLRDEAHRFGDDPEWQRRLDGQPEVLGIESLDDSAVTIRVLVRTRPPNQWDAGREFRRRVKIRLDKEGIDIPYPQRTIHVRHESGPEGAGAPAADPVTGKPS